MALSVPSQWKTTSDNKRGQKGEKNDKSIHLYYTLDSKIKILRRSGRIPTPSMQSF